MDRPTVKCGRAGLNSGRGVLEEAKHHQQQQQDLCEFNLYYYPIHLFAVAEDERMKLFNEEKD